MPIPAGTNSQLPWRAFYAAVDGMQLEPFMKFIDSAASMRVANYPEVRGLDNIRQLVSGAWSRWTVLRHNFENVWELGDTTVVEAIIDHVFTDGREVTTPCVTVIQWRDGKLLRHRAFEDTRPLE